MRWLTLLFLPGCTVVFVDDSGALDTDPIDKDTTGDLDSDIVDTGDTIDVVVDTAVQPGNRLSTLTVGGKHYCIIEANQSVSCFGNDDHGQSSPPSGAFTHLSAGMNHTCGLTTNGSIQCWGWNEYNQTDVPDDTFDLVAAGGKHSCGISTSNTLLCWGGEDSSLPQGVAGAVHLSIGEQQSCIISDKGDWHCWKRDNDGTVLDTVKKEGNFYKVAAGPDYSCVTDWAGHTYCKGINYAYPESDVWVDLRAGLDFLCALDAKGSASCRTESTTGMEPPQSHFTAIDVSDYGHWACGLNDSRAATAKVECWGPDIPEEVP